MPDLRVHHAHTYDFGPPRGDCVVLLGKCRQCGAEVVKLPVSDDDLRVLMALIPHTPLVSAVLSEIPIERPWLLRRERVEALLSIAGRSPPDEAIWHTVAGERLLCAFEFVSADSDRCAGR